LWAANAGLQGGQGGKFKNDVRLIQIQGVASLPAFLNKALQVAIEGFVRDDRLYLFPAAGQEEQKKTGNYPSH